MPFADANLSADIRGCLPVARVQLAVASFGEPKGNLGMSLRLCDSARCFNVSLLCLLLHGYCCVRREETSMLASCKAAACCGKRPNAQPNGN